MSIQRHAAPLPKREGVVPRDLTCSANQIAGAQMPVEIGIFEREDTQQKRQRQEQNEKERISQPSPGFGRPVVSRGTRTEHRNLGRFRRCFGHAIRSTWCAPVAGR